MRGNVNNMIEFIEKYGNIENRDEFHFHFNEMLDDFYSLKNDKDRKEYIKDIDFSIIKDKVRRAFINSTVLAFIKYHIDGSCFEHYFTGECTLDEPTFYSNWIGEAKLMVFLFGHPCFKFNNLYVGRDVLDRV